MILMAWKSSNGKPRTLADSASGIGGGVVRKPAIYETFGTFVFTKASFSPFRTRRYFWVVPSPLCPVSTAERR